jgi:cardiolipin synthase C
VSFRRRLCVGVLLLGLVVVAGCASLPKAVERVPSHALPDTGDTVLDHAVATALPGGGLSGFRIMAAGDVAYSARLSLANNARRSLDLQYYWVASDAPTRALFAALRRASERGVRVRLLLDDLSASRHDAGLLRFATVENVQVRVFNPFAAGRANALTRMLFSVGELSRVTRRMHNKMFIADNALAIVGGRNLTAEYFSDDQDQNFADLDVLAGGAIVGRLSRLFDEYWNSNEAYPIEALVTPTAQEPASAGPGAAEAAERPPAPPDGMPTSRFDLDSLGLVRAPARALADSPAKAVDGAAVDGSAVFHDVLSLLNGAKREVLIVSPYFIPTPDVMALLERLRARNVSVRVLTNSLASTDMPPVFAAYSRRRVELLRMGVELYELRPSPQQPRGLLKAFTASKTALHAKAVLVDGEILFVGSMNLDPRSKKQNTEDGIVIDSQELGARMARIFALGVSLDNSYAVRLTDDGQSLEWVTRGPTGEVIYSSEPEAGFFRRLLVPLLQVTVPEDLL